MNETVLREIAATLGVAVTELWAALLRQAPIWAMTRCITFAIFAVVLCVMYRRFWLALKRLYEDPWNEESVVVAGTILAIFAFSGFLFFTASLPGILAGFFNPEYWALKEILNYR